MGESIYDSFFRKLGKIVNDINDSDLSNPTIKNKIVIEVDDCLELSKNMLRDFEDIFTYKEFDLITNIQKILENIVLKDKLKKEYGLNLLGLLNKLSEVLDTNKN